MECQLTLTTTITEDVVVRVEDLVAVLPASEAMPLLKLLRILEHELQDRTARNIVLQQQANGHQPANGHQGGGDPARAEAVSRRVSAHYRPADFLKEGSVEMRLLRICGELREPFITADVLKKVQQAEGMNPGSVSGQIFSLHRKGMLNRVGGTGTTTGGQYQYRLSDLATNLLLPKL